MQFSDDITSILICMYQLIIVYYQNLLIEIESFIIYPEYYINIIILIFNFLEFFQSPTISILYNIQLMF